MSPHAIPLDEQTNNNFDNEEADAIPISVTEWPLNVIVETSAFPLDAGSGSQLVIFCPDKLEEQAGRLFLAFAKR